MPNDYSAILSAEAIQGKLRRLRYLSSDEDSIIIESEIEASHTALLSLCGELREALDGTLSVATGCFTVACGSLSGEQQQIAFNRFSTARELLAAYPLTKGNEANG